jgi:membrane-associated tyrosine/threonine-specific cdc2-inhibitory kinase
LPDHGIHLKVKSKDDGQYYAVKRSRGAFRGSSDRKEKISEVAKYEKLAFHPNCVQFYLAWEEKRHLYIQTELCLTSLHKLVSSEGGDDCLPERLIWSYLLDLLRAIQVDSKIKLMIK